MSNREDEAAVDAALRHTSVPPDALGAPAQPAVGDVDVSDRLERSEDAPGATASASLPSLPVSPPPSLPPLPSFVALDVSAATGAPERPQDIGASAQEVDDLEAQRRARAERLRAAEDAAAESAAARGAEGQAAYLAGLEAAEPALAGEEGLRRRRGEGVGRPPDVRATSALGGGVEGATPTTQEVKTELQEARGEVKSELEGRADGPDGARGRAEGEAGISEGAGGGTEGEEGKPASDERQCRICFGGWEDEVELGKLISPCLCAGSMRYVHVKCINQWRGTGVNAKSFMECPQCHHQYSIRRTVVSGLATSKPVLYIFTTILFLLLTFISGHILLRYLVAAAEVAAESEKAAKAAVAAGKDSATVGGMTRHGDVWENEDGSVIIAAPGLTLVYDIVVEAVDIFLDLAGTAYDYWPRASKRGLRARLSRQALAATIRIILGLSVLGSLSFLSLLASLSLFAPLQLVYTLWGTGIFRGPLENLRRRAPNAGGILVIAAVIIGIANSVVGVYDLVRAISRKLLAYVETTILEVNPEEARLAREAAERQPHWFDTWIAERRWRRLAGWYEVMVRLWEWVKDVSRGTVARVKASVEARVAAAERARDGVLGRRDVLVE